MTTWTSIPTSVLDVGKPVRSIDIIALRDNISALSEGASGAPKILTAAINDDAITAAKIAAGQVGESELAASAVTQAKLKTTTGSVSVASAASNLTLAGGQWGFLPTIIVTGGVSPGTFADARHWGPSGAAGGSAYIYLDGSGGADVQATQRYIQASPPYDLGDGEIPIFVFALVDSLGKIVATYCAEDPPWANNGPTDIRADFYVRGRAFQRRRQHLDLANRRAAASLAGVEQQVIEVTQEIKQADMPLIPHPFIGDLGGKTAVLIDPVSSICDLLREANACGESIPLLLHAGHLRVDNVALNRKAPPGVMPVAVRWR